MAEAPVELFPTCASPTAAAAIRVPTAIFLHPRAPLNDTPQNVKSLPRKENPLRSRPAAPHNPAMSTHYHTIILGAGAMGSAAAAHLQRRLSARGKGEKVLALEQFDIPNTLGSSHGQSRLIRLAYYEHPDYVPLLRRAYELWRELETLTGIKLLHITGGLYLGPPDHELITGSLASAREHTLEHDVLSASALQARFPQFHLPAGHTAVFETQAGFLLPEKAVAAHALLALQHGADLRAHESALEWSATDGGVTVRTAQEIYTAQHLVITAGPWTARLLPFLANKITVTRQPLLWFWPKTPAAFSVGNFPCWCASSENYPGLLYGPPMLPDDPAPLGLKISHHTPGAVSNPDTVNRSLLPTDVPLVRDVIAQLLPDANGPLLTHKICLYSNSPDQHFLIDHHPQHKNVTFAAGFSGHGFKFSAVIGELLADLALTGATRHPISFLRMQRLDR
jgi:sarcosine oxidase